MRKFIDRESELETLERQYTSRDAALVILYGSAVWAKRLSAVNS